MAAMRAASRFISRRFSSGGRILSEEEKAAENVYIKVLVPHLGTFCFAPFRHLLEAFVLGSILLRHHDGFSLSALSCVDFNAGIRFVFDVRCLQTLAALILWPI